MDLCLGLFYGYDLWLGATDITATGVWEWVDSTPLSETFSEEGEYDSMDPACLELEADAGHHWNIDFCDDRNFYICERPCVFFLN